MIFKATFIPANANAGYLVNKKAKKLGAKDFLEYKAIYKRLSVHLFQDKIPDFKTNPSIEFSLEEASKIPAFDHETTVNVVVSNPKAIEWAFIGHTYARTDSEEEIKIEWTLRTDSIKEYWQKNGYKTNI